MAAAKTSAAAAAVAAEEAAEAEAEAAAVAVGPKGYCWPRHVIQFKSRNEGLRCG